VTAERISPMADVATAAAPSAAPAILVVDDDAGKRLAIRSIIAPLGYRVVEVDSGRAALRAVMGESFAIILMDVRMPTLDGYETARLIRERSQTRLTPIIFVTASVQQHPRATDTAYASGAVDFIFTPIIPDVLRAKVSTFVELYLQSQELKDSLESITALHAALRESEELAQAVLQNVADGIVTVDEAGRIESFNRSARRLFGYTEEEVIGQSLGLIIPASHHVHLPDRPSGKQALVETMGTRVEPTETIGRRKDGSCFPMDMETSEMRIGERTLVIGCIRDISERQAHIEALGRQALHDPLTGLPNRTLFGDRMNQAIASGERAKEPRGVLVLDINSFKQVNDTLGHDRGDTLLLEVGKRIVAALRKTDTVARLGGDEFGILLYGPTDLAAAATSAWKIQQSCEAEFVIDGQAVRTSLSIGIALFPEHGATTSELLRHADLAMYDAKRSGCGHAVFDAAQETQMAHSLTLLADLRGCVSRDELVLHYQPQIDLATRRTTGVEALVRWQHPTQGLVQPAGFLPQMEGSALIAPLTRWVLNEALRQQQIWRADGLDLTMAVNISARTLKPVDGLPGALAELTDIWGSAPGRLTLELTEGALVEGAARNVLTHLHDIGAKVSIDDFGMGYSSLAYLQHLAVDQIKIDRSFVMDLASAPGNAVIVRSTIDLAHNLGLTVVAEGVEDELTLDALTEYGCDSAQGYFFTPALTAGQLTTWLAESRFGAGAGAHPVVKAGSASAPAVICDPSASP
jgi:diguanylate cyclase (GGDEF)-like protein/PAS domain S-box-containing protein